MASVYTDKFTYDDKKNLVYLKREIKKLEKKYRCTFEQYELYINSCCEEVFEEWDDYIDWQGMRMGVEILEKKLSKK